MADVVENLNALHKEVFAEGVPDLIPQAAKLQQEISFDKEKELGLKYVRTVRLAYPGGFTHEVGDGTAGAFSLNDAKSGTVKRAEVTAYQIVLKDQMDYETAAKASAGGKKAFKEGTAFFYEGMQKAARKRLETNLLWGQNGLGVVGTYTSGDPSVTLSAASFAPGIWAGLEGTEIDVHSGSTSTVRGTVTVAGVDIESRKITLSGTVSGCAANDVLRFKGSYSKEMMGLYGILTTDSKFGIDGATYSLWKAVSHSIGGAASFVGVKKGISKAVAKGLDEDLLLLVNPGAWDDIMTDIASLRRTDKNDVKKVEIGAEEIVFHSQNGMTRIVSHIMMKEGNAMGLCRPKDNWSRLGAADFTFGTPGFGDDMFHQLQGKAGIEARSYSHQALFCDAPAKNIIFTDIVNS